VNLAACAGLSPTIEKRVWYRAIGPKYSSTALSGTHTTGSRSRFSAGPLLPAPEQFQILYFAEDPLVALYEFGAMLGNPLIPGRSVPNPSVTTLMLNVAITLGHVFDLTDVVSAQATLQTTTQELTGDWDGYQLRSALTSITAPTGVAPTQELGLELFRTGIEGFRSISAKIPFACTLMVFPTNLRRGSSVVYTDGGRTVHRTDGTK
jgi:hypothetical protein